MFLIIAVIPTSFLSSETSHVPFLSGDNFADWKDKLMLTLGCMDLDLAFRVDEPPVPTDESTPAMRVAYENGIDRIG